MSEDIRLTISLMKPQVIHCNRIRNTSKGSSIVVVSTSNNVSFCSPEIMSLKTSASNSSLYSGNGNNNGGKGHTRNSSYDSVGSRGSKVLDEERLIEFLNNKGRTKRIFA